jgi:hypothetical protein
LEGAEATTKELFHRSNLTKHVFLPAAPDATSLKIFVFNQNMFRSENVCMAAMVRFPICEESSGSYDRRVDQGGFESLALLLFGMTEIMERADDLFWGG